MVEVLVGKLKFVRSHLTGQQFEALIAGRLDVQGFMAKVKDDRPPQLNTARDSSSHGPNVSDSQMFQSASALPLPEKAPPAGDRRAGDEPRGSFAFDNRE